jgi:hypothetical protein
LQLKIKAQFTLGVKANVKLKSNISIGAKVETSPKGFTQGIKVETFFFFNMPQVYAELYGLILAPRVKKGYCQIWEANLQSLGPMFQHLLIS